MNHTIFVVTYRKDFEYLKYCLLAYDKFSEGFEELVLVVPGYDFDGAVEMVRKTVIKPVAVRSGEEWPDRGMLWAMTQKCRADEWCPRADIIFHIDADCVFTEPVTPLEYVKDGKPILLYESFASMNRKGIDECNKWQICVQECLPFDVLYETMRWHPEVYHRNLYEKTRELVEQKTKRKFDDYVQEQRNAFPQTFAEFNTLGNVALHCFADQYELWNLEHKPWPPKKLHQGWGHNGMRSVDMDVFRRIGIA